MNPQAKFSSENDRTVETPAQEWMAAPGEASPELPAEQVYAQRLAESSLSGDIPGPVFVP